MSHFLRMTSVHQSLQSKKQNHKIIKKNNFKTIIQISKSFLKQLFEIAK